MFPRYVVVVTAVRGNMCTVAASLIRKTNKAILEQCGNQNQITTTTTQHPTIKAVVVKNCRKGLENAK